MYDVLDVLEYMDLKNAAEEIAREEAERNK